MTTAAGVSGTAALVLATCLLAANAYSGYVPNVRSITPTLEAWGIVPPTNSRWDPQEKVGDATHGAIRTVEIPTTASHRMSGDPAWVYTPPGYDPASGKRYPVVYFFHGSPGRPSDPFTAGDAGHALDVLIAHDVAPPMIIVSVDVNGSGLRARDTECLDSTTGGSLAESHVVKTVVPWVDAHLPTIADREHRIIAGASAGGFCALNLGLRHTDQFGTILALMPYAEPVPEGDALLSSPKEISANTPLDYIPTMQFAGQVNVFIDFGPMAGAEARREARRLAGMLIERGQHVELREEVGFGHTWDMARAGMPYALRFAGTAVDK